MDTAKLPAFTNIESRWNISQEFRLRQRVYDFRRYLLMSGAKAQQLTYRRHYRVRGAL